MRIVTTSLLLGLLCWFALPGCAVANRMSGATDAREIQRMGQETSATILELWDTGITVNDDPVVGLRVNVLAADGSSYEATIRRSRVSRVHVPQVQPGLTVRVYVDPRDRSRVALGLYDLR